MNRCAQVIAVLVVGVFLSCSLVPTVEAATRSTQTSQAASNQQSIKKTHKVSAQKTSTRKAPAKSTKSHKKSTRASRTAVSANHVSY